ncbi:MAG TPA: methyltransferase domain-containing protein [Syntrophorhabdales bacterium]|nr:methyltransferase domain-containing protein [Syntrophorhabdales bacterium]
MKEDAKVKEYFTRSAKDFDDIYEDRGSALARFANRFFRKGMRLRFEMTLELCGSEKKSILDIGCGAGRFTIPLAERGMDVVGIDYSSEMIRMAEEYVKARNESGATLRVTHLCCDFVAEFDPKEKFDVSLAIGVLDYIREPLPFIKKMKEVTRGLMITAFPAYTPQAPIRKIWLSTKDCPVFFYTKKRIVQLYAAAGITDYEIIPIPAAYLVKAKT